MGFVLLRVSLSLTFILNILSCYVGHGKYTTTMSGVLIIKMVQWINNLKAADGDNCAWRYIIQLSDILRYINYSSTIIIHKYKHPMGFIIP